MKSTYTGYYRTKLSPAEKQEFKALALKRGSVAEVHDDLLREFIRREKEGLYGVSDSRITGHQEIH
mgnify:CR=1 FL=1